MSLPDVLEGAARTLFIYYRVPAQRAQELGKQVLAMQTRLRLAFPGLDTRLMQRADEATPAHSSENAEVTWMEIYSHADGISQGCEDTLSQEASALIKHGMGARHVEAFLSLMPS